MPLSLDRSVTMDAWSADQLKKMQVGGNGKLNAFFKNYGIPKETEIKQKYSGQVAEVRAKNPLQLCGKSPCKETSVFMLTDDPHRMQCSCDCARFQDPHCRHVDAPLRSNAR